MLRDCVVVKMRLPRRRPTDCCNWRCAGYGFSSRIAIGCAQRHAIGHLRRTALHGIGAGFNRVGDGGEVVAGGAALSTDVG